MAPPEGVSSFVLVVDDSDAPNEPWDHWIIYNMNANDTEIEENSVPKNALIGTNSWGKTEYGGPCPPMGTSVFF